MVGMWWLSFCVLLFSAFVGEVVCKCRHKHSHCWSSESHFPQLPATEPCYGETLCHCSNTTANCSLTHGALRFVPDLGRDYQVLNFSYNNVSHITDTFFVNASREVRIVDLYNNGLVSIAPGAFRMLTQLTTLLLGGLNHIGYRDMPELLLLPSLTNISFSCVGLQAMPPDIFKGLDESRVIFFDLSWNRIGSLNLSIFQPLRHLREVVLWRNEIYELDTASQSTWEVADLSSNRLYQFPQTCFGDDTSLSLFPNLKNLTLDYNMIDCIGDHVCLPNLTFLSLNFNRFEYLRTDTFSRRHFPSLKILYIMQMENKILKMDHYFVNNSEVRLIKFIFNEVDFHSSVVHEDVFAGCPNVEELQLTQNNFQQVSDDKLHKLFQPFSRSLKVLFLGNCQIKQITPRTFRHLNLTELLLFENYLTSIPDGAFDHQKHLKKLILDTNSIKTISDTTFSSHLQKSVDHIQLGNNPFQCSCDIMWFQRWFRSEPGRFQDASHPNRYLYQCANVNNVSLADFVLNDQACILGSDAAALTISIICVLITFFVLFAIFFRFRWHIRLVLYELCRGRHRRRARARRFRYDMFVSYAEENAPWVRRELMPRLEEEWGLRLCLHYRDFVPGKPIMDNISDCVDDSNHVLLVFSPSFAQSEWCQFELKYCHACVMERDEDLVLVMMQGTQSRHLTGPMMALLRTTTYLEWADHQEARASFWARLRLALQESED